ncbi:MAG: hypothetical protein ABIH39_04220, partial [Candidatus Margulisiibacteriota bacterium]
YAELVSIDTGNGFRYDLNIKDYYGLASGGTVLSLDKNGNVGIGTTAPLATLHVHSDTTSGNAFWLTTDGAGATDEYFVAMRSDQDGTPDNEFLFKTNGDALADGSFSGGGADYAEWFEKEGEINDGALIGLNLQTGKARVWQAGDPLLGVQSMNPAFIGNNIDGSETDAEQMKQAHVLVALVGQVEITSSNIVETGREVKTSDGQFIGWRLANGKVYIK